jgi:small subunit ribosomal protein S18
MARKVKLKISTRLLRKKARRSSFSTEKRCRFCSHKDQDALIDYKNVGLLRNFLTERGKMLQARISGSCAHHQRQLAREIKRARTMILLPFTAGY